MFDYLIVGAGLFGATFAYEMSRAGKSCILIDKRNHIGGLCYTECIEGINVHMHGAHIFRTDDIEQWQYLNKFATFNSYVHCPVAVYHGKVYSLPFNMHTFYEIHGARTPEQAIRAIEKDCVRNEHPQNLEEYCLATIGRKVYETLVKEYTEKQWQKKCSELPPDIMPLPIRYTFDNRYFSQRYQGIPIGGYTQIFEKMLCRSEVVLNADYFAKKDFYDSIANKVLYTGKIDDFYGKRFGELEYRSLMFSHLILNERNATGCAVVNYTGSDVLHTRTTEHKHFENTDSQHTVVSYEYPAAYSGFNEPYYPINTNRNNALYERYKQLSESNDKYLFGGRLGTYSFDNMDKSIRAARLLAKQEIRGGCIE